MENKPLKRSKFLIELSRDHHSSLLFCWKIKEGLKKSIAPARVLKYINFYWEQHIRQHFREEETLLFNRISEPLSQQAKTEHLMLEERLRRLNDEAAEGSCEHTLFAELLIRHIRFEERILFPFLETALPEHTLKQVSDFLAAQHSVPFDETYPDQFWLKTKVG